MVVLIAEFYCSSIPKSVKNQRIMVVRPYTSIKTKYIAKYVRNTLLSCKQTSQKRFSVDINGSPRHLNIVSDFHTWSFSFVYKLKTINLSKWVIEYSLPHILLISSYIITFTNKALILSLFWKRQTSYFPAKKNPQWTHMVGKTHCDMTAIVSQTWKFWI